MSSRPVIVVLALAVASVLAVVLTLGYVRFNAASSRLPHRGTVVERVIGCEHKVEVALDHRGIPHVVAATQEDAWFAQGYLHARDRFFQMELARRTASGRLAEIFGEAELVSDRRMRTLRLAATAQRQATQLSPDERRFLEAYTAGVNAALERFDRWIAPELWLLGVDPEAWRLEDSLSICVLLQLNLSWSMGEELERAVLLGRLGQRRAVDLWGWTPAEARAWIPPVDQPTSHRQEEEAITRGHGSGGSNTWALAPARTAGEGAVLAVDLHLPVTIPGAWHAIHLEAEGLHVAGASIPGVPGVIIGHTAGVVWGLTMSMVDDQDLYVLSLDESRSREMIDGVWRPLRTVSESIHVRWRDTPEPLRVRFSERGPVVRENSREVLALAWSGHFGPSPVRAFLAMARSENVAGVAASWEGVHGPSMNLVAADVNGHILHQVVGMVPERGRGAGRLPAPGSDSAWAWRGFLPLAANPHRVDPADGFISAANHDLFTEGDYPGRQSIAGEFMPPWRVRRIRSSLAARTDWDAQGCVELQRDAVSGRAIAIMKQLWPELKQHGGPTARALQRWDGKMDAAEVGPHLFSRLLLELSDEVGGDEALREGLKESPLGPEELLRLLVGGVDESWWDDLRTQEVEGREEIILRCLTRLDRQQDVAGWGDVHRVGFKHPLSNFPLIGSLMKHAASRGPFPASGDEVTLNAHHWSRSNPFEVTVSPSLRLVADVGDWDSTLLVLAPGESGRPWSPHFADQVKPWLEGGATPLPFSRAEVIRATRAGLVLLPRR